MKLIRSFVMLLMLLGAALVAPGASAASSAPAQVASPVNCSIATPASQQPTLSYGSRGSCVKLLQQLLVRETDYSAGLITGYFGPYTDHKVEQLQTERQIVIDGIVGPQTWGELFGEAISHRTSGPSVRAIELSKTEHRVIDVNKDEQMAYVFTNGGEPKQFEIRSGGPNIDPKTGELKDYSSWNGAFQVYWKSEQHVSHAFDASMPYALFYNGGEALHFSPSFARYGHAGWSHGCINIADEGTAEWLFNTTSVGDYVIVHGGIDGRYT